MDIPNTVPLQMIRTNPAHVGTAPLSNLQQPITQTTTQSFGQNLNVSSSNFQNYLVEALGYVNAKQNNSTQIAQQMIIDPDSVDVHDVTTAMAEAQMSLNLAQNVIDRVLKGWTEITTTR